jgi:hypothetical protein
MHIHLRVHEGARTLSAKSAPEEVNPVFEEFQGIPMHPLLVHAAVVFLPLQVLGGVAYAVLPRFRRYLGWFVVGVAVIAPGAAFIARQSGLALRERLIRNGTSDAGVLAQIQEHNDFGDMAFYTSLALGVILLALVAVQVMRTRRADDGGSGSGLTILSVILMVATLAAAGATGYYVFKTGDTGAKMTWNGR